MNILLIDAILFFADYEENVKITEINGIDQDNEIAYFTLQDGRLMYVCYKNNKLDFYFDEEN